MGTWRGISFLLLAISCCATAGEPGELTISDKDGVYRIRMEMQVDAPAAHVYQVLTDFRHIYRLNPSITESKVMSSGESDGIRVRTLIEDCVLLRCMRIARTETVYRNGNEHLHVVTDPEHSDFKSGITDWWILPDGETSRVVYQAEMEPDFFIPPVIGRFVMKKKLREGILTSFENLECIARVNAGLVVADYPLRDGYPYLEETGCGR
ncbi:MAG: SRPBCC family protein [Pseudomonadota bacterium]|nr:SRPBCC family protein [Pseudomonadota bacterium]